MKRLQISIEPDLDTAVERRADQEGVSKAEVIRRCVREQVKPLPPIEEDPFFKLCGTVEGDSDSSTTIDDVVYGLSRDYP
ncbi:MAG: CopG family transcriptional regulator [Solirubrobacterales bacterium]